MKKIISIMLFLTMVISAPMPIYASGISSTSKTVKISSGNKTLNIVTADLTNPNVEVFPVLSNNQVCSADNLNKIAESFKLEDTINIAAINGDFFAAYDGTNLPYGISQRNGEIFHAGGNLKAMSINSNKDSQVNHINYQGGLTFTKPTGAVLNWNAWGVNHIFEGYDGEVVIYTPYYGEETKRTDGISAIVKDNKIIEVVQGNASIPKEGYTVYTRGCDVLSGFFAVGDNVTLEHNVSDKISGEKLDWSDSRTIISGGPIIVKNSKILDNFEEQGFSEAKILTQKAQRSFILITADKKLIFGTVSNTNMKELSEIALALGAVNALNLDGGASSGLYYNGKMITTPGRKLTNVIIVREQKPKSDKK